MRRSTALILALLLALMAVAVWLLVDRPTAGVAEPDLADAATEVPPAPEGAAEAGAERGSAAAAGRPLAPGAPVQEEDDPAGSLRLEGQVVEAGDLPVEDALVRVSSRPERTTRTERDGTFAFDGLLPKRYSLTARAGERVAGPVSQRLSAQSDPVILRLRPGAALEVRVGALEDGRPIPGARVGLRAEDDRTELTDAAGLARFSGVAPGFVVVAVQATGRSPVQRPVSVPESTRTPVRVEVSLARGAPVQGRVLETGGGPVAGARVLAEPSADVFGLAEPDQDGATTDAEGRFAFEALAPGSYRFGASHPDHPPADSGTVQVEAGRPTPEVRIELAGGGRISGRVVDEGGRGVPYAQVRVAAAESSPYRRTFGGTRVRQALGDADGAFRFQGLPRTRLQLAAQAEGASSDVLPVDLEAAPAAIGLEVRLARRGRIAGTVKTAAGEPVAEAEVLAVPDVWAGASVAEAELRGPATAQSDGAGAFVLQGLPEGAAFRLWAAAEGVQRRERLRAGVSARTGDEDVRLVVEEPGSLRGQVQSGDGAPVTRFSVVLDFPPGQPVEDAQGRFLLPDVPAGEHTVSVRADGFADLQRPGVQIQTGQETDLGLLVLQRGRRVSGRVLDGAGAPVPGAEVVSATQLVGDGSRLTLELGSALDESLDVRRTRSGPDGAFALSGVSAESRVVVAEAGDLGRSEPASLPAGQADVQVELRLKAFGSLAGRVTLGGQPAAGAMLNISPKGSTGQAVIVRTGEDGAFAVERLPAGEHHVLASIISSGGLGSSTAGADVTVRAGEQAQVQIDVPAGDVTLLVSILGKDGAKLDLAQALLLPGKWSFASAAEINQSVQKLGAGLKAGFWMPGQVMRLDKVASGEYSLCVIPINGNMADPVFMQRLQKSTALLKVYCQPVTVTPTPAEQAVTAVVPPMDPLPADPAAPGTDGGPASP
jgi:protocatechuate 3,4-dioxygenase beta subunit